MLDMVIAKLLELLKVFWPTLIVFMYLLFEATTYEEDLEYTKAGERQANKSVLVFCLVVVPLIIVIAAIQYG